MNKMKYFDKYQLLLAITAIGAILVSLSLFVAMVLTGTRIYDENGALVGITYNNVLQVIFTIFFLTQLIAVVWFIARTVTYKLRVKEEDI